MQRLTRRADFLAAAAGGRVSTPAFTLQIRDRADAGPARFGFTVSRKVGTAVERNRVRRRLKATVRLMDPTCAKGGHDYVMVGRRTALTHPFSSLAADLDRALKRGSLRRAPGRGKAETGTGSLPGAEMSGRAPRADGSQSK